MLPSITPFLKVVSNFHIRLILTSSVSECWTKNEMPRFLKILSQQNILLGKDSLGIINGHITDSRGVSASLWYGTPLNV